MPLVTPTYRTDVLACPLNAGKLLQVRELVTQLRTTAGWEAKMQWQQFHRGRWLGFESMARKGWTRPWVTAGSLSTSYAQMVMSQVAGALTGHLGQVRNTYTQFVSGSSLPATARHQLHSLNRRSLWFNTSPVTVKQEQADKKGKLRLVTVVIPSEVMALARRLIRRARDHHRKPHFKRFQPQVDQRGCFIKRSHTAQHPDWLMLSLGREGKRLALPLSVHRAFVERNATAALWHTLAPAPAPGLDLESGGADGVTGEALACDQSPKPGQAPRQATGAQFLADLLATETHAAKARNPYPSRFHVPNTVRLLLDENNPPAKQGRRGRGQDLRLGLVTDMGPAFAHQAATYTPMKPDHTVCMDLGLSTLLATDDGELHGRDWMRKLGVLDKRLTGIARHRQRLGLRVADSERYRQTVQQLRGWLKTEIHRILNRLVTRKRPARIVMEALDFKNPAMSRRMNRLISNFGKRVLTDKLKELESHYGIVTEYRPAAYTSQECHSCHYVDKRNRVSQSQFECKFCGLKQHADVQASRVLRHRRSVASNGST